MDKKKALNYLYLAAPIAAASNNKELISSTKIVKSFRNKKHQPFFKFYLHVHRDLTIIQMDERLQTSVCFILYIRITGTNPFVQKGAPSVYERIPKKTVVLFPCIFWKREGGHHRESHYRGPTQYRRRCEPDRSDGYEGTPVQAGGSMTI